MRFFSWKWNVLLVGMVTMFASVSMADEASDARPSSPETWNQWETRGVRLGTPRKELIAKGFTCGKAPRSPCYKLVDKRCTKHARCELKQDAFNNWFELNGQRAELDLLSIEFTDSDSARVYKILYRFGPRQLLTPDSVLGKALIAKYGRVSGHDDPASDDPKGGGRMTFGDMGHNYTPQVIADCSSPDPAATRCSLQVEDYAIQQAERSKQEDIDKQRRLAKQPQTAPEL